MINELARTTSVGGVRRLFEQRRPEYCSTTPPRCGGMLSCWRPVPPAGSSAQEYLHRQGSRPSACWGYTKRITAQVIPRDRQHFLRVRLANSLGRAVVRSAPFMTAHLRSFAHPEVTLYVMTNTLTVDGTSELVVHTDWRARRGTHPRHWRAFAHPRPVPVSGVPCNTTNADRLHPASPGRALARGLAGQSGGRKAPDQTADHPRARNAPQADGRSDVESLGRHLPGRGAVDLHPTVQDQHPGPVHLPMVATAGRATG
jgi:hypothetical protein